MKVVTEKVRASYVNVFRARPNTFNGQDEYSMVLLIPKTDRKTIEKINRAIEDSIAREWNGKTPENLKRPLRDGDVEKPGQPGYVGCYFMTVKGKKRPGIVDAQMNPVIDESEFMSGDYCHVSMNSYAYDHAVNKGVSFGLNNIQVLGKGEPLGGRARPEDDFSAVATTTEEYDFG